MPICTRRVSELDTRHLATKQENMTILAKHALPLVFDNMRLRLSRYTIGAHSYLFSHTSSRSHQVVTKTREHGTRALRLTGAEIDASATRASFKAT